jgi:hypothetical protein
MRIVSDFHDYYDAVQASGQDQSVVYVRMRKEVKLDRNSYRFPCFEQTAVPSWRWGSRGVEIEQFIVGFCGKVYPILSLSHQGRTDSKAIVDLCFTLSDVDAFIEQHFKRHEIEAYRSKPRGWRFSGSWDRGQRREKFREFFDAFAAKQSTFAETFIANQCPIFVASVSLANDRGKREFKIVYNGSLKELGFFRIMDTFTAFQELQMYVGAMAQPNKPIPSVSDEDMVSAKGFDKWSFRKPPGKKR